MVRPATRADKVEDGMTETLYQYFRTTDVPAELIRRNPGVPSKIMAKGLSDGAMDGKIGEYVKQMTNDCPRFKKSSKNALYRAFLRCLTEYKQKGATKNGDHKRKS